MGVFEVGPKALCVAEILLTMSGSEPAFEIRIVRLWLSPICALLKSMASGVTRAIGAPLLVTLNVRGMLTDLCSGSFDVIFNVCL